MPISKNFWEKGRSAEALESSIETFLANNKDKAFTESEIRSYLYPSRRYENALDWVAATLDFLGIGKALDKLLQEGRIKSKSIKEAVGEQVYYTIS